MNVTRGTQRSHSTPKACVATIGNFDGVHKGHQKIIADVTSIANKLDYPATLISFEPLPTEFFSKKFDKPIPDRIYPFRDKAYRLNSLGIDHFVCLPFSQSLSEMPAEAFITDILVSRLNIKHLVVGDDFRFGKQRLGDFSLLKKVGKTLGMSVSNTPTIEQNNSRISSTRIRKCLAKGQLSEANSLLGKPYQLSGRIRHGDKRGRTIGFPTLNLKLPDSIAPAKGAYAVKIHGLAEKQLKGVANIGNRPTVSGLETRLETHVFNFDQQVYGKHVCIELVEFLRAEKKFENFDELMGQITKDSEKAKAIFAQEGA